MLTFLQPITMRLDCRFTVRHASEFLDGELSRARGERIRRHVSVCPGCAELLRTMRRTIAELRGMTAPTDDGSVVPSVLDALRGEPDPRARRRSAPRPPGHDDPPD